MDLIASITTLLTPYLEKEKLSLYDIEIVGGQANTIVRVFIDCETGVTHKACAKVSQHLSTLMDVEETIPGEYVLEVSSPGLTRALKKPEHFRKSIGKLAKINFRVTFEGPKSIIGKIVGEEDGVFMVKQISNSQIFKFRFEDVAKARLEFEE